MALQSENVEPTSRRDLRVLFMDEFCGCGNPDDAAATILRLLELHPLYGHLDELEAWMPDMGIRMLLMYMLDRLDLTEHGTGIWGAWLTDKGQAVRDGLRRERDADNYEEMFAAPYCVHGYDHDDRGHDCFATEREEQANARCLALLEDGCAECGPGGIYVRYCSVHGLHGSKPR